jgi:dynein heavy chain
MFFDGAEWDKETMTMKDPSLGTSCATVPVIHLLPSQYYKSLPEDDLCPVYRTQIRAGILASTGLSTSFVVAVHLKVDESAQFWTLRGAAILLGTPN